MKKGVSEIIATILMLVITIGLAGTAYVYISGMLTGKTAQTISLMDASCDPNTGDTIVVFSNDGTQNIDTTDMAVYVDNSPATGTFTPTTVNAHTTGTILISGLETNALHTILVTSPTNSGRIQVQC